MANSNITKPINQLTQTNPNIKEYRCPYCNRILFKGNVKKINMACQHCQKLIRADEHELLNIQTDKT